MKTNTSGATFSKQHTTSPHPHPRTNVRYCIYMYMNMGLVILTYTLSYDKGTITMTKLSTALRKFDLNSFVHSTWSAHTKKLQQFNTLSVFSFS